MDDPDVYKKSMEYWSEIPATVNGMLGGLGKISSVDLSFSERVLRLYLDDDDSPLKLCRLLEVGAGIGRITKHLLNKYCNELHLLEANKKFLDAAPAYMGKKVAAKVTKYIALPLQDFYPEPDYYDCIWCQWVLAYLKDEDLVDALKRLKASLRKESNGVLFIKENISKELGADQFDGVDNSVTRTREEFLKVFDRAELSLLGEYVQTQFPEDLFQVRLFALR